MLPPLEAVPLPLSVAELTGRVMVTVLPAFATGGGGGVTAAGLTMTLTVADPLSPLLSVTFNENT